MKKKIFALTLILALAMATLTGCGSSAKYNIGVCQLVQHPALDAATQGFIDAVTEKLGAENVKIDNQNASGDSANCATIVNSFVAKNVDLILANATPALQAAAAATNKIPVLGTSITEYGVALELDNFSGTVGTNVSGTSDLAPLDQQAAALKEIFPSAKTVGLLYCSAEPNSLYQVKTIEKYLNELGFTCEYFSFSDSNDISAITTKACAASDVIYIPTDNSAASNAPLIDNIARAAKTPIFAGEEGICKGCGVATLSISYYDIGYATGLMAVEILKDGKDVSKMAIQYAPKFEKKYNKELADFYGLTIPSDYAEVQ